jgi:hypothetical protein
MNTSDQSILDTLKIAVGLLELSPAHPLRQDVKAICNHFNHPNFRIAVFAPFNYGKSTLLNALLGERTLPIDLIPTTGAAIVLKYGSELQTHIQLTDGSELCESGSELLSRFAILDQNRRMRDEVAAVEVCCPHPFLQLGVEFIDLPGTDDRVAQDTLVKNQLLSADLVIQVLDGRKLMTLQEREILRDWLLDRGIETVIFVVNFLNLLAPDDQKQVLNRLRFVAESFRAQLPPGVSNLYRVDALPALRARLKGDAAGIQTSGLPILESALQTIMQTQGQAAKRPRLQAIAEQVKQALQHKIDLVNSEVGSVDHASSQRIEIQRQALTLIRRGFSQSTAQLKTWLAISNLLSQYETGAISALGKAEFSTWETTVLKQDWLTQKRAVTEWIYKACDFLEIPRPTDLWVAFPDAPDVILPDAPTPSDPPADSSPDTIPGTTPIAIATGLGWVLGGPLGAAVLGGASYLLNQTASSTNIDRVAAQIDQLDPVDQRSAAVQNYFNCFSTAATAALSQYEATARKILTLDLVESTQTPTQTAAQAHQLALLQSTLDRLQ